MQDICWILIDMELTLVVSTFTYFYMSTLLNWTFWTWKQNSEWWWNDSLPSRGTSHWSCTKPSRHFIAYWFARLEPKIWLGSCTKLDLDHDLTSLIEFVESERDERVNGALPFDWSSIVADFCRLTQVTELDTKIAKCDEARHTWKKMKKE